MVHRYIAYFLLRGVSTGLGFSLSVVGISTGADYGRLVAWVDSAKPVSGLFDSLALRTDRALEAWQLLTTKGALLVAAVLFVSLLSSTLLAVFLLWLYVVAWWLLTTLSTIYMRAERPAHYFSNYAHTWSLLVGGIRLIARDRPILLLVGTSTFAAMSYGALYVASWTKGELLALRAIDLTVLVVGFTAQLLLRGERISRRTSIASAAVCMSGIGAVVALGGPILGSFCLCRIASMLLCARAMRHGRDSVIAANQVFLGAAYQFFTLNSGNVHMLPELLCAEIISLVWLAKSGAARA